MDVVSTAPAPAAPRPGPLGGVAGRTAARPRGVSRILWAHLVAQGVIVVPGGVVRLTGSGLGCSTWPECEPGQFTPVLHEAVSWHPLIEFGNRTLTGVLGVIALAVAWVVWRERTRALSVRLLGLVPLVGVAAQAIIGGLTVRGGLHPAIVGSHFLVSMVLVAASTALLIRHREGDAPAQPLVSERARALGYTLLPLVAVVLALGVVVTGSGPHSGDDEAAYRFALDPAEISRFHSASVWVYVVAVVALAVLVRTQSGPRRAVTTLLVVTLLQGLIGYVQYFTHLPPVLVALHMLGASVLVIAQVHQTMSMRSRGPVGADGDDS